MIKNRTRIAAIALGLALFGGGGLAAASAANAATPSNAHGASIATAHDRSGTSVQSGTPVDAQHRPVKAGSATSGSSDSLAVTQAGGTSDGVGTPVTR